MSNSPILREDVIRDNRVLDSEPMTINGALNKCFLLTLIAFTFAALNFYAFVTLSADKSMALTTLGMIAGFITALVLVFKKEWAPILAPVYAAFEGLLLGGISVIFEAQYPGIVLQSVALTFLSLFSMLFLFRTKMIQATDKFRSTIFVATLSIAGIYLVSIIGSFFNLQVPYIHSSGTIGIVFSLIVVVIASLNFILDFDFIERAAQNLLPKYFEWFTAFGVLVTLVWVYIEILKLVAKLRDSRN